MSAGINVPSGTGGNGVGGRKKGKALEKAPLWAANQIPSVTPTKPKVARQLPAVRPRPTYSYRPYEEE